MNTNQINALNEELSILRNRIQSIKLILALQEPKEIDIKKNKLFNTLYKCPVCYEFEANRGNFKCKHYLCRGCYSRLSYKKCPECRSV